MLSFDELNEFIKNYIENDRTGRAIMISGCWGTGKSYYIKNSLAPFLANQGNVGHECVVVSLYGCEQLADISRRVFWEIKSRDFQNAQKKITTKLRKGLQRFRKKTNPETENEERSEISLQKKAKRNKTLFIAKTILNGVANRFNINTYIDKNSMKRLFESVDLSGKLLVFEDVERSNIDIVDLLGYINSLTEQDGVKILLVANEKELIAHKEVKDTTDSITQVIQNQGIENGDKQQYTEETNRYLRAKEKTIGDTIEFLGDFQSATSEIIKSFRNMLLTRLSADEEIKEIDNITTHWFSSKNLRSFIFACQKTVDVYNQIGEAHIFSDDYYKTVFYSMLILSYQMHSGKTINWNGAGEVSREKGVYRYPLFRFCYDYVMNQHFDLDKAVMAEKELVRFRMLSKEEDCDELKMLKLWHRQSEKSIRECINKVEVHLAQKTRIPYYQYGDLAYYIVKMEIVLEDDFSNVKDLLVRNLGETNEKLQLEYMFNPLHSREEDSKVVKEYVDLRERMIKAMEHSVESLFDFTYVASDIPRFYEEVINNCRGYFYKCGLFASRLDNEKIVEMIKKSTAEQLDDFRCTYISVYLGEPLPELAREDLNSIEDLCDRLKGINKVEQFDRIQRQQLDYFIGNLDEISRKLSA